MKTTLIYLIFAATTLNILLSASVRTVNLPFFVGSASNSASVTAALALASSGDIVYVAQGVYAEAELTVPTGVTLIGGLPGAATFANQRISAGATNTSSQWTILDGGAAHRVATVNGTIDGCIIRNGKHDAQGGGVYISSTGIVQNCFIRGNQCQNKTNTAQGGAAYMTGSSKLINCVIDFNMASTGYAVSGAGSVINNTIVNNCNAPVWILIPAGSFSCGYLTGSSGTPAGGTANSCSITVDYYLSQTETTNAQYAVFAASQGFSSTPSLTFSGQTGTPNYMADGSYTLFIANATIGLTYSPNGIWVPVSGKENYPLIDVTWYGALAYSQWLGGMLPTEAQWEYGARRISGGFSNHTYAGSNTLSDVGVNSANSGGAPNVVATLSGTVVGLYDMSGNVWEWCSCWYVALWPSGTDPVGPISGSVRVIRGGSCGNAGTSNAVNAVSNKAPDSSDIYIGFRPLIH